MHEPLYPSLYQVNTRVWLTEFAKSRGRPATLDDIPDAELDQFAATKCEHNGNELQSSGLYLDVAPWQHQIFAMEVLSP